jgi:hypothetical protein
LSRPRSSTTPLSSTPCRLQSRIPLKGGTQEALHRDVNDALVPQ